MRVATPWIYSPKFDLAAIIGPPVAVTAIVLAFGNQLSRVSEVPVWLWIVLVLGIDVAHVYSSLFRTYFDREEFERRRTLYIAAPILCWLGGVTVFATFGQGVFWSLVAYFAIYHFVRQQYGFMMLYRRGEPLGDWGYRVDQLAIYLATIYPLVYWHTYPRKFQWFSGFEMLRLPVIWPEQLLRGVYAITLLAFLAKELHRWIKSKELNGGKILLLLATAASWATGIIVFNGDLTFTLINIVSHGIPYMALIWIYQYRKRSKAAPGSNRILNFFQLKYLPIYVGVLLVFAYLEEGMWDWFVWREQPQVFGPFHSPVPLLVLTILVPLLTMPQLTHYVLDAYIWRVNKKGKEEVRAVIG